MEHMESDACEGVTQEQFLRARMVNAVVNGIFGPANDRGDSSDSEAEQPDLESVREAQSAWSSKCRSERPNRGQAVPNPPPKASAKGKAPNGKTSQKALSEADSYNERVVEMNFEQRREVQTLAKKMLGSDLNIRCKVNDDGTPYPMEVLHPLSPFFNAELFQNVEGRYECAFIGCK